jgi:hypothetical protein
MTQLFNFDLDQLPSEDIWLHTNTKDDDANWARKEFEGITGRQAWQLFFENIFGAGESIGSMPDDAFKYYIVALAMYVAQLDFVEDDNASAAASCLFGYLEGRRESGLHAVRVVLPLVSPVLNKLAANQASNDMPIEIYGDLSKRAQELLSA